jgi:sigma-E factor negative regulatory protein RseC
MEHDQEGVVVTIEGSYARIEIGSGGACMECGARGECGTEGMTLLAYNGVSAVPGDRVRVEPSASGMLTVSFVLFMFPMLAAIAGFGAGALLARPLGIDGALIGALVGAASFALSIAFAVAYDRRAKAGSSSALRIAGILDGRAAQEERCF